MWSVRALSGNAHGTRSAFLLASHQMFPYCMRILHCMYLDIQCFSAFLVHSFCSSDSCLCLHSEGHSQIQYFIVEGENKV